MCFLYICLWWKSNKILIDNYSEMNELKLARQFILFMYRASTSFNSNYWILVLLKCSLFCPFIQIFEVHFCIMSFNGFIFFSSKLDKKERNKANEILYVNCIIVIGHYPFSIIMSKIVWICIEIIDLIITIELL